MVNRLRFGRNSDPRIGIPFAVGALMFAMFRNGPPSIEWTSEPEPQEEPAPVEGVRRIRMDGSEVTADPPAPTGAVDALAISVAMGATIAALGLTGAFLLLRR
jgi:hypothetical protein